MLTPRRAAGTAVAFVAGGSMAVRGTPTSNIEWASFALEALVTILSLVLGWKKPK